MNKKKIISLALSVLIILPTTAFAKGHNDSKDMQSKGQQVSAKYSSDEKDAVNQDNESDKDQEKDSNKGINNIINDIKDAMNGQQHNQDAAQNKDAKKQQIEQFKTAMRAKHDQMNALRVQIKAQRSQIDQKKEQLEAIVDDLKSGDKTLSPDMLSALLTAAQNLKLDVTEVKATTEINNEVATTQTEIKNKDFNNALASMDKVIAKLQKRLDALKQLNADLDTALAIANKAVAPAPATTTTTTTTGTDTTTTTGQTSTGTTTTTDTNTTQTAPTTTTTTDTNTIQTAPTTTTTSTSTN